MRGGFGVCSVRSSTDSTLINSAQSNSVIANSAPTDSTLMVSVITDSRLTDSMIIKPSGRAKNFAPLHSA